MAEVNDASKSRKKKKFVGSDTFLIFLIIVALPVAVVYFSNRIISENPELNAVLYWN